MSRLERWHWRPWFGALGGVLALVVLLPPVGAEARRYVFAQAVQFAVLATAVPALVVLGAPWRLVGRATLRLGGRDAVGPGGRGAVGLGGRGAVGLGGRGAVGLSGPDAVGSGGRDAVGPGGRDAVGPGGRAAARPGGEPAEGAMGLVDRLAAARSHRRPGAARCLAILLGFLALAVFWRLPLAVNALVTKPALTVVEAVTLLAVGIALWFELVESPPLLPRMARPLRAAFAAVPMWTIWATAYIMGFSHATWFSALGHRPKDGLGVVADQEIAAVVLWAIPGLFFIPVVYFSLITWLRDTADPDDELRNVPQAGGQPGQRPPRPPRGWRLPPV